MSEHMTQIHTRGLQGCNPSSNRPVQSCWPAVFVQKCLQAVVIERGGSTEGDELHLSILG